MFKNVLHVQKKNVAIRLQVKCLLTVKSSEIIRSSFLSLTLSKFHRKPFLVRNLYFSCSVCFYTFSQD